MKTILGIWAHPDDEVFVSGGLMADAVRRGDRVECIHMTYGEGGLFYREPAVAEELADIRERELEDSLTSIGVADQCFLDFPDGCLNNIPGEKGIARIYTELVRVQPDVVVTFGPDGFTGHPDHQILSSWVTAAIALWNNPTRLYHTAISSAWKKAFVPALNEFDFFYPGYPIADDHADVTLELDKQILDRKVEALSAHASQMEPLFYAYGEKFMRAVLSEEHFRLAGVTESLRRPAATKLI